MDFRYDKKEFTSSLEKGLKPGRAEQEGYSRIGLRHNPFPIASVSSPEDAASLPPLSADEAEPIKKFFQSSKPAILKVAGDYGSGKTHLLLWIRDFIRQNGGGRFGVYYISDPGISPRDLVSKLTRAVGEEDLGHKVRQLIVGYYQEDYRKNGYRAVANLFGGKQGMRPLDDDTARERAQQLTSEALQMKDLEWTARARKYFVDWDRFLKYASGKLSKNNINAAVASDLVTFAFIPHPDGAKSWANLSLPTGRERYTYHDHFKAIIHVLTLTGFRRVFLLIDEFEDILHEGRMTKRQVTDFLANLRILLDDRLNDVGIIVAGTLEAWERVGRLYPALEDRITSELILSNLTEKTARTLVANHIALARNEDAEEDGDISPFTERDIKSLLDSSKGNRRLFIKRAHELMEKKAHA